MVPLQDDVVKDDVVGPLRDRMVKDDHGVGVNDDHQFGNPGASEVVSRREEEKAAKNGEGRPLREDLRRLRWERILK